MTPMLQLRSSTGLMTPAEGFDIEPKRRMRIGVSAVHRRPRQRLHRVHHIHHDRELGFETLAHGAGPGFEFVDVVRYRARVRETGSALPR